MMQPQNQETFKSKKTNPARPLGETMLKVSGELERTAHACLEIQWLISSLLERAHHPDLPAELHMLQDIDRLQQTLTDIASLIEHSAPKVSGIEVADDELNTSMKLDSLQARIFAEENKSNGHTNTDSAQVGITWF